jgi:TolB protein
MKQRMVWTVLAATLAAAVQAQEITITKSAAAKTTVDLAAYRAVESGPALFLQTLQNDLFRSGWLSPGSPGRATYAVQGECQAARGGLQAQVQVVRFGDRRAILQQTFTHSQGDARRLGHSVADAIIQAISGNRGLASCRIVMVGAVAGGKELFICDADGGNLVQLTRDKSISLAPSWSPRGDQIVYTSFVRGFADVYLVALATGKRLCLARYPGMNMGGRLSPDGRDLALILSKDGNPELYIKNLASGKLARLTRTPRAGESSPAWSPNGSQIVYASDEQTGVGSPQLFIVSRASLIPRRITSRGSENVCPDWGTSGLIAYASKRGNYTIVVYDPATQEHRAIATDGHNYEDPSWAPDGRHIVCTRTDGYQSHIYLLDTMGDPPIRLTPDGGNWRAPACSP